MFKRILGIALAAGTVLSGVAHAGEYVFRYQGKIPTRVATATSPTPARLVSPVFNWDKGSMTPPGMLSMDIAVDAMTGGSLNIDIPDPDSFGLSDLVGGLNAAMASSGVNFHAVASAEDGRLVLTTTTSGATACLEILSVYGFGFPDVGFLSVPEACGTDG